VVTRLWLFPPQTLSNNIIEKIQDYTKKIAIALKIKGPFNIQFLVKGDLSLSLSVTFVLVEAHPTPVRLQGYL